MEHNRSSLQNKWPCQKRKQGVLLGTLQTWKPKTFDPVWGDISECRHPALQCVAQRRRFWEYTCDKGPHWALLMDLPRQRVTARPWMSTLMKSHGWVLEAQFCWQAFPDSGSQPISGCPPWWSAVLGSGSTHVLRDHITSVLQWSVKHVQPFPKLWEVFLNLLGVTTFFLWGYRNILERLKDIYNLYHKVNSDST